MHKAVGTREFPLFIEARSRHYLRCVVLSLGRSQWRDHFKRRTRWLSRPIRKSLLEPTNCGKRTADRRERKRNSGIRQRKNCWTRISPRHSAHRTTCRNALCCRSFWLHRWRPTRFPVKARHDESWGPNLPRVSVGVRKPSRRTLVARFRLSVRRRDAMWVQPGREAWGAWY